MLALICDLCGGTIKDTGVTCDLVEAKLVISDEGPPRMTERGQILSLYMCDTCAKHVRDSLHTYRARAGEAASRLAAHLRGFAPPRVDPRGRQP